MLLPECLRPIRPTWLLSLLAVFALHTSALAEPAPGPASSRTASDPPGEAPGDESAKARARVAFARGLELANEGRYEEAKTSFLAAHALVPHPVVAYNAALACIALGERERALELFDVALAAAPGELTDADREAIQSARVALAARASDVKERDLAAPAPNPPTPPDRNDAPPKAERTVSPAPPAPPAAPSRAAPAKATTGYAAAAGYVTGAAGLALLAGASAVFFWNDARHEDWQRENVNLNARQSDLLASNQIPSQDAELRKRAEANDALLESIQTLDDINIAIAVGGLAGIGIGTYLILNAAGQRVQVGLGRRLELRGSF
jgi:tetratricopeptide (TPR) repeat protein